MPIEKVKASNVKLGVAKDKPVRFSYLNVFKPRLNAENNKMEYSVQILVPKTNVEDKAALDAAYAVQLAAYKAAHGATGKDFHNPIKDGDTLTDAKGNPKKVPGHWVVSAKTAAFNEDGTPATRPGVVGTQRDVEGALIPLTADQVKSGDWGRASINLKFFGKGKGGVGAYLNSLQKTKTGESLGGQRSASEEFAEFEDDEDPLA